MARAAVLVLALVIGAMTRPPSARAQAGPDAASAAAAAGEDTQEPVDLELVETVVVTASRTEQALLDAPATLTVIDRRTIETSPASNVAEMLRGIPGLNVIQTSAREWNVRSRGAAGAFAQGTLALVDGRPVNEPNNGLILWDHLSIGLDELEQVEVLHGPGSAIWGADALTGVVNLRTRAPRDSVGGTLEAGVGERDLVTSYLRWADAPGDVFSYKVSATYLEQDAWDRLPGLPNGTPLPPVFQFEGAGTRQRKLDARFDWDTDERRRWSLRAGLGNTSGLSITRNIPLYVEPSTATSYVDARYDGPMLSASFNANHVDGSSINAIDGSRSRFRSTAPMLEASAHDVVGRHHLLTWGGSWRRADFEADGLKDGDARDEAGAFIEDQIEVGRHLLVNLGVRADHVDTFGVAVSPRVTFIVQPDEGHAIRFGWHRAYRPPTLLENYLVFPTFIAIDLGLGQPYAFPTLSVGNEDLEEVRSEGIEIGWTGQVADRHLVQVAAYRVVVEDDVQLYPSEFWSAADPPPGWPLDPAFIPPFALPKTFTYRNVGRVENRGLEASWSARWTDHLSTTLSWAFQQEPRVEDGGALPPVVANAPPQQTASVLVTYSDPDGRVKASGSATWTDDAFWADVLDPSWAGTTDDFLLVNGSVAVRLGRSDVELVIEASNLLDEAVQQHVLGDVIRRQVTVSARWQFGAEMH